MACVVTDDIFIGDSQWGWDWHCTALCPFLRFIYTRVVGLSPHDVVSVENAMGVFR